jgi:hypothetical protein
MDSLYIRLALLVMLIGVQGGVQSFAFSSRGGTSSRHHSRPIPRLAFRTMRHTEYAPSLSRVSSTKRFATPVAPMFSPGNGTPENSASTVGSNDSNGGNKQLRKKKLQTFLRYLEVECWKRQDLRGLESVLQAVASACKQITRIVQRAQTDDVYGVALDVHGNPLSDTNIQGEVQQKLDVLCNTIMLQAFCGGGREIHSVASEEEDEPRCCSDVMVRCRKKCCCDKRREWSRWLKDTNVRGRTRVGCL